MQTCRLNSFSTCHVAYHALKVHIHQAQSAKACRLLCIKARWRLRLRFASKMVPYRVARAFPSAQPVRELYSHRRGALVKATHLSVCENRTCKKQGSQQVRPGTLADAPSLDVKVGRWL